MSNNAIKIVLHIDETLSPEDITRLETQLACSAGIIDAHLNTKKQHLMLVNYQPHEVTTSQVLQNVINQGVHAELIGGI